MKIKLIYSFCLLLLLFAYSNQQLIKHVSNCLNNCLDCQIYNPAQCIQKQNSESCQYGYIFNKNTKKCQAKSLIHSNYSSSQFQSITQILNNGAKSMNWNQGKITQCSYLTQKGVYKYLDVIGLFKQVHSISKQFQISDHHQFFYFSFNLVRSSWMINHDFLIVDFQSGTKLLSSYQISKQSRQQSTQNNIIMCNEQPVVTQKYTVKVNRLHFNIPKIKITFTGFLFTSVWGITNIKFIPGCQKFTVYNRLTQNCDFCNIGYYPVYNQNKQLLQRCKLCQFKCNKCLNQSYCTSCIKGYRMWLNNTCIKNDDYQMLEIIKFQNSNVKTCKQMNMTYFSNSDYDSIQTVDYRNKQNVAFGDVKIVFQFIYNTKFQFKNITLDIFMNDKKISHINQVNLTNYGFQACSLQSLQRYSVMKFTIPLYNVSQSIKLTFKKYECIECKFGVNKLNIVYVEGGNNKFTSIESLNKIVQNHQTKTEAVTNNLMSEGQIAHEQTIKKSLHVDSHNISTKPYPESQTHSQKNINKSVNYQKSTNTNTSHKNFSNNVNSSQHDNSKKTSQINHTITSHETISKDQTNSEQNKHQQKVQQKYSEVVPISQVVPINNTNKIDHISFSKQGNNGIIVKLDYNQIKNFKPKQGQVFVMQLKEITYKSENQQNHKQKESQPTLHPKQDSTIDTNVFHIAASQEYNQDVLLSQTHNQSITKSFTFFTDKTYIDDKITIYALQNNTKTELASFYISRTDYLETDSQKVLSYLENIFITFTWVSLFIIFISLLTGKYFLVQQSIQSLQILFLGIYIFTSYLPASILNTLSGLRRLQNLDFFAKSHIDQLQHFFLGNLVQDSPLRFTLFHRDINFIRSSIPLFFLIIIIGLWYLIIFFIKKNNQTLQNADNNENNQRNQFSNRQIQANVSLSQMFSLYVVKDITQKKINYLLQVIKVLFLPFIFLTFKQFNNFKYPQGYSGQIINLIFCMVVFLGFFAGTTLLVIYCSNQYFKLQYETFIQSFQAIYYKKIPKSYLPTQHNRIIHPLFRYFKIFFICLLIAFLGNYPMLVTILMIIQNASQIFYCWFHQIYQDSLHFKFMIVDNILMCVLYVLLLIISQLSAIISTSGYLSIGYVYMSIAIVVILNNFSRMSYSIINYVQKIKNKGFKQNRISLREEIVI